jgi:hypothetical protein
MVAWKSSLRKVTRETWHSGVTATRLLDRLASSATAGTDAAGGVVRRATTT